MSRVYAAPMLSRMRKRIAIEAPPATIAADGAISAPWTQFCQAWARIEPTGGAESYVGGLAVQQDASTFTIRMLYQPGIKAAMRAIYQGRTFNFINVNDTGELHRDLVIQAKEVTN